MSDRPTPESKIFYVSAFDVEEWAERCLCLEQERDEARTELEMWRDGNIMHEIHRNELEKVERERDEAREALKHIEEYGTDEINAAVDLRQKLAQVLIERDEARIDAQKSKAYKRVLKETNLRQTERIRYLEGATNHACGTPLSVALRERDEARDAIVGWENKWKCAIDMAARAELERDEALKCAKEYYVEFIRNASSDNKISKPNPLNPFYKY